MKRSADSKIIDRRELPGQLRSWRLVGQSVAFTNGCFDMFHAGHLAALEEAAGMADVLLVAVDTDASVRKLKGEGRPVIREVDRCRIVAACEAVDCVLPMEGWELMELLREIRPAVLFKGGSTDAIVGEGIVHEWGGRAVRGSLVDGASTTGIIGRAAGIWLA